MEKTSVYSTMQIEELSYVESKPIVSGKIKIDFSDFRVKEDLGFTPTGNGEHAFVQVTKKGLTTLNIAKKISEVAGHKLSAIGYSGMKDKNGECTQWFSFPFSNDVDRILNAMESTNLRIVASHRNQSKLKIGSHKRNDFNITIRSCVGDRDNFENRLKAIQTHGVPNYFGMQRFGHKFQNISAVRDLMATEIESTLSSNPEKRRRVSNIERGILISSARAYLFNQVLSLRLELKNWSSYLAGDVLNLNGTDSYFVLGQDDQEDMVQKRIDIFDIHISGPLAGCFSSKDKYVTRSKAADIEVRSLQNHETLTKGLKQLNVPATRRPLRFRPENLQWSWKDKDTLNISFSLRKGCYATSLLREVCLFS